LIQLPLLRDDSNTKYDLLHHYRCSQSYIDAISHIFSDVVRSS